MLLLLLLLQMLSLMRVIASLVVPVKDLRVLVSSRSRVLLVLLVLVYVIDCLLLVLMLLLLNNLLMMVVFNLLVLLLIKLLLCCKGWLSEMRVITLLDLLVETLSALLKCLEASIDLFSLLLSDFLQLVEVVWDGRDRRASVDDR